MTVGHLFDRRALGAALALSISSCPAVISATPVTASTPVQVSASAPTSTYSSPTVSFGGGAYLAAWIVHPVAGSPGIATALITHGATMHSVVVRPLTIPLAPVAGNDVFVTSAFDGSNFVVVWPSSTSAGGVVVSVARIQADGTPVGTVTTPTIFTGTRVDVGCNGSGVCMLASVIGTASIAVARESMPAVVIADFMQGVPIGDPAIEFNGTVFEVAWTRLGTSPGIISVPIDPTGLVVTPPSPLLTVSATDHARIACDRGSDCVVVAPHGPAAPRCASVFASLTGAPSMPALLPATPPALTVRPLADVVFHGPDYLVVSESDTPMPTIEALFVPRTGTPDPVASPITDPAEPATSPAVASNGVGRSVIAYVGPNAAGGSGVVVRFVPALAVCMVDSDCPSSGVRCLTPVCSANVCGFQSDPACLDGGDAAADATDESVDVTGLDQSVDAVPDSMPTDGAIDAGTGSAPDATGPNFRGSGCACSAHSAPEGRGATRALTVMGIVAGLVRRRSRRR